MIAFITNYDEATLCNYKVYVNCGITPTVSLLSDDATAENLASALTEVPISVFAMSHGNDNKLCDQQGNDAFNIKTLASLSNGKSFNVFAYACNTSRFLGQVAAQNSIKWFGFFEPISPPETDTSLGNVYVEIFNFIYSKFPNVSCSVSALEFLEELKLLCDEKIKDIDKITLSNGELPPFSAYSSVKQIWARQKVWLSENESVVHPEAPAPILW